MKKQNNKVIGSLLISVLAVILLCMSAIFGNMGGLISENSVKTVQAEEQSAYAAYLSKGGNNALLQLPDKQQSYVYFGDYLGTPVRWTVLQNGTMNNGIGTMLYSVDDSVSSAYNYQFFNMAGINAYMYNLWSSSYIRAYFNGTPYSRYSSQLTDWSEESLTDTVFGTSGKIRNMVIPSHNATVIYADRYNTSFEASYSHISTDHVNFIQNNYDRTKAYFDEIFEFTEDYLFPLSANEIIKANGFSFLDNDGNESTSQIVSTTTLLRNNRYFACADGVRVGTVNLRNSTLKGSSTAARVILDNGRFESETANSAVEFGIATNVYNNDFQFVICGTPESGWVNGTVASTSGNRPAYKAFIKGSSEVGSIAGIFPTDAYVLNGRLNIDLSKLDGNNYIDKYMLVIKDASGNVVSSRGVDIGNYEGLSAITLDESVLFEGGLKEGYTLETFGYKSTEGNSVALCTQSATVQVKNKREVVITLDGVSALNEVESRVYGNAYNPITATAIDGYDGTQISDYVYEIQYNNESATGEWTTTVPTVVGRYFVRAYGAPTETYLEAVSDVAYLTITKATATVEWSGLTHKYDGTQKNPSATWAAGVVVPTGDLTVPYEERINAGSFTVNATYNGEDIDNFNIVGATTVLTIERVKVWVSLGGRASYGNEAVLRAMINTSMSDPIPDSEKDNVRARVFSVTLATDWTPTSIPGRAYYIYVAGHNESLFVDYDLIPNYAVEWRKAVYYPSKANVVSISWSANDYTYNGAVQTITAEGLTDFNSTVALEITVNKEFKNAASDYVATAAISSADAEYIQFGYSIVTTKEYEIKKATASLEWTGLSATYDGTQKNPAANWAASSVFPTGSPEIVYSERINAGSYTVNATYNGEDKDNFDITNNTATLTISPIVLEISWIDDNHGTKTYDGTAYTVNAAFTNVLAIDVLEPVITGSGAVNASDTPYVCSISGVVAGGSTVADNYVLPTAEYSYTIVKRAVSVSWSNTSFIYNAQEQKPVATWIDAVSLKDGSELTVDGGKVNASDVAYTATAVISGADADNFTITNETQGFTIAKRAVSIQWIKTNFIYNGTAQIPTAAWADAEVLPAGDVEVNYGEMINAGSYSVNATYSGADKDNFSGTYSTAVVSINKVVLWVDLNGQATYDSEAVLSWSINEGLSNPIPAAEIDYVHNALNSVTLETDWTPFSDIWGNYYAIVSGHNESMYFDDGLLSNYTIEWVRNYFFADIAAIVSISWSNNDYTYNGAVQTITAIGRTAKGTTVNLEITVDREFKNAANGYVATATISAADFENFDFDSGVITDKEYEIKKATASVEWTGLSATYDGTQKNPAAGWEAASVVPTGSPEIVYGERINAGNYTVNATYNGADKDNFDITDVTETFIIARAEITVSVILAKNNITFGEGMNAGTNAVWLTAEDGNNTAALDKLISGYAAGDNAGTYIITLDFTKAEDESRRLPETYLDNYNIIQVITAELTVNKKAITSSDIERWTNEGLVVFSGKTVVEDGNVHTLVAQISGEAADYVAVIGYTDIGGAAFSGATESGNYDILAVLSSVNGNYEVSETLSARLRIFAIVAIKDTNGNVRGYVTGLDPDHDYVAVLTENPTSEYVVHVGTNGIEITITITDENGNPANSDELTYLIYPPTGYDTEKGSMYIVNGGTLTDVSGADADTGGIGFNAQTNNGIIQLIASSASDGLPFAGWFFWLSITGTTIFGLFAIIVILKKIRDEYAEK